tara:strand:+ start:193 stop:441 length:249 start_codon:yes stop_codon:yes gene_type:complete
MLINTKITNFPITKAWEQGQLAIKEGKMNNARDYFDMGIAMVAAHTQLTGDGSDDLIIEKKPRKVWLMRFWKVGLENNNLLL